MQRKDTFVKDVMQRFAPTSPGFIGALVTGIVAISLLAGYVGQRLASGGPATITIPARHDVFVPFILTVQPNTTVTWTNGDASPHAVVTTPEHTAYLNPVALSLHVSAGASATFTFTTPGLYDYYDTGKATWNREDQQVAADAGVAEYPLSMEGVVWVQGSVAGVPSTASETIPGRDLFASEFLAITAGGAVRFHNADTDRHVVLSVPGWAGGINPSPAILLPLAGTDDAPPDGQTSSLTFTRPGLYYFYCSIHATIQQTWRRAQALSMASEQPIAMQGFVLVVPRVS